MSPPWTATASQGWPSRRTSVGVSVTRGRLPGSTTLNGPSRASVTKLCIRCDRPMPGGAGDDRRDPGARGRHRHHPALGVGGDDRGRAGAERLVVRERGGLPGGVQRVVARRARWPAPQQLRVRIRTRPGTDTDRPAGGRGDCAPGRSRRSGASRTPSTAGPRPARRDRTRGRRSRSRGPRRRAASPGRPGGSSRAEPGSPSSAVSRMFERLEQRRSLRPDVELVDLDAAVGGRDASLRASPSSPPGRPRSRARPRRAPRRPARGRASPR